MLGRDPREREGAGIGAQVGSVALQELQRQHASDRLVHVIAAQERVTAGGEDLEEVAADRQQGDVERPAAEVDHGDPLVDFLPQPIGEGRRGRLVEDPQHAKPGELARPSGRFTLSVREVGRDRDHAAGDRRAEEAFGVLAQLDEHEAGDLDHRLRPGAGDHDRRTVRPLAHLVRKLRQRRLHRGRAERQPDQALDGEDRVARIDDPTEARGGPDDPVARRLERHHRRVEQLALRVGDHRGAAVADHRDHRVGRSEIDSYGEILGQRHGSISSCRTLGSERNTPGHAHRYPCTNRTDCVGTDRVHR